MNNLLRREHKYRSYLSDTAATVVEVENIKGLERGRIDLQKNTILCGPNSSGKSSIVQALLLLKQESSRKSPSSLELNGRYVQLGEPEDAIRNGQEFLKYELTYKYSIENLDRRNNLEEGSSTWGDRADSREYCRAKLLFGKDTKAEQNEGGGHSLTLQRIELCDSNDRVFTAQRKTIKSNSKEWMRSEKIDPDYLLSVIRNDFIEAGSRIPAWIEVRGTELVRVVISRSGVRTREISSTVTNMEDNILTGIFGIWGMRRFDQAFGATSYSAPMETKELRREVKASISSLSSNKYLSYYPASDYGIYGGDYISGDSLIEDYCCSYHLGSHLGFAMGAFNEALKSLTGRIRYLGPLRQEPVMATSPLGLANSNALPVGIRGELAAKLFDEQSGRRIWTQPSSILNEGGGEGFKDALYASKNLSQVGRRRGSLFEPPSNIESLLGENCEHRSLSAAVADWIGYLGIGDAVHSRDYGKLGSGLQISLDKHRRDLTEVGVGASQLLPVVLISLLSSPGDFVILEQPELHLHPAVQARLFDFLALASPGVQYLVETHSEYLVTRTRRRAAEIDDLWESFDVQFAERGESGFEIRDVDLDSSAVVWPKGFFDTLEHDVLEMYKALSMRGGNAGEGES